MHYLYTLSVSEGASRLIEATILAKTPEEAKEIALKQSLTKEMIESLGDKVDVRIHEVTDWRTLK